MLDPQWTANPGPSLLATCRRQIRQWKAWPGELVPEKDHDFSLGGEVVGSGGDLPRGERGPDDLKPRIGSTVQAQVREEAGGRIQDGGTEGASSCFPQSSWRTKTSAQGGRRHGSPWTLQAGREAEDKLINEHGLI